MARAKPLPGMEDARIEELDLAAEAYVSARNKRMKLTDKEVEAQTFLGDKMAAHKLTIYKTAHGEMVKIIPGKAKVKVEAATAAETDGKGDDE